MRACFLPSCLVIKFSMINLRIINRLLKISAKALLSFFFHYNIFQIWLMAKSGICKKIQVLVAILRSVVQAAGLTSTLSDPTLVATIFAPTDDAFTNLLKTTGLSAAQLLNNTDILTQACTQNTKPVDVVPRVSAGCLVINICIGQCLVNYKMIW